MFARQTFNGWIAVAVLGVAGACVSEPTATSLETAQRQVSLAPAKDSGRVSLFFLLPGSGGLGLEGTGPTRFVDAATGLIQYKNLDCVASATMFIGGSGDAILQPSSPTYRPKNCGADYPRKIRFRFFTPDASGNLVQSGSTAEDAARLIVVGVHGPSNVMPIDPTETGWRLRDGNANDGQRCARLAFRNVLQDGVTVVGADRLRVRRVAANMWEVQTQPDTTINGVLVRRNKAWCENENRLLNVPVHYFIRSFINLPLQ